ncbi:MAG TPA: DUF2950 domain-containing protein [Candidatus Methylomirabilis sp.]|nr:DUF2950 domain-containing protein [Candidatus Methylomirabilis sp.]
MRRMGSSCTGRCATRRSLCACVLWLVAGFLFLPAAFGQGKGNPQKSFATPEAATKALAAAYQKGDDKTVAEILGDKARRLVLSGDPVIDRHERAWFLSLYQEGHEVVAEDDSRVVLQLGKDEQPYPIPLIKKGAQWRFDSSEGHEDLVSRRIGKTELTAVNLVSAYVDAQRAYKETPYRNDGVREFAQRFRSTPGQRDGLLWEGQTGKVEGPIATLVEAATKEGYLPSKEGEWPVYRGYVYKILTAQGPLASGGAREYIVNGRMTEGFALVAFPVRYGISGIMTFLVNQDGVIYQNDLGPKTVETGRQMTRFNPDKTWTKGKAK